MIKKVIYRTLWILVFIFTIVLVVWANMEHSRSNCSDININMHRKDYPALTSEEAIKTNILKKMPTIIGQSLSTMDLQSIENLVKSNSQLEQVKAFLNINGDLLINVSPRKAILHIFDAKGQNLYLGEDLYLMNNSPTHTQRIMVASGHIPYLTEAERKQLVSGQKQIPKIYTQLYDLAKQIRQDPFLETLIDQIYVYESGEVELTPKVGVKRIYFGKINHIEEKLLNLKAFYINGKNQVDWQVYQSINLKYSKQIVCSKK